MSLAVVIIEDSPLFQEALARCVEGIPDAHVAGIAGTVGEGVALVERLRPGVVLMDVGLPDGDGISAMRRLHQGGLLVPVVVVTIADSEAMRRHALASGAWAFLSKARIGLELGPLLYRIARG